MANWTGWEARIPAAKLEKITVGGNERALYLEHPESSLNGLSLKAAEKTLRTAMGDLYGWPKKRAAKGFGPLGVEGPGFELRLDMDHDHGDEDNGGAFGPMAADVPMAESVSLDPLTVVDDAEYWDLFEKIAPERLHALRKFYQP